MSDFYSDGARRIQDRFDTRRLADRFAETIVHGALRDEDKVFIESRDFFFLSTVDADGWPQCSYKGGAVGMVRAMDANTLLFPSYDGNGMYLSMGNIADSAKVGLLFVDFESPKRLRVRGNASLSDDPALLALYHEAQLVVRVDVDRLWPNCPRYIHRYTRVESSQYVPKQGETTPVPAWKQMDFVRDVLPR